MRFAVTAGFATLILAVSNVAGQSTQKIDRILPHVRYFASPIADPLEPRLGVGLTMTNLFRADGAPVGRERARGLYIPDPADAKSDVNAATAIGGTLPWYHIAKWSDSTGIVFAVQAGVVGRFR